LDDPISTALRSGVAFISIFNDVLGPVMRGPSSSHTAGAHRIGLVVRDLIGSRPTRVRVTFDPRGSMAPTWRPLGVDLAFTAGIMGWSMLDEAYVDSINRARDAGVVVTFESDALEETDHPNGMLIEVEAEEAGRLRVVAEAVGGGGIRIVSIDHWFVELDGKSHAMLVEVGTAHAEEAAALLPEARRTIRDGVVMLISESRDPSSPPLVSRLLTLPGVAAVRSVSPVFFIKCGEALFGSAEEMVAIAHGRGLSLGEVALAYESEILGLADHEVVEEMLRRFEVMEKSAVAGLDDRRSDMLLLEPTAAGILRAEEQGSLAVGGIHTRAAARAMAVMHHCNSRGVVCAAPTGGSAGTVPGVVISLVEELALSRRRTALALLAAGIVGLIVARRATFAAEIAGCQVEIGVAGAMAAAAVVEAAGGSPQQAADAAAISLQNTMGSPCDPVAGACEVPCHTRNAAAASSAFTCADLILGGYHNPIPLDESIDASYAVGKELPSELRCTAKGGCAVAPSALGLKRRR
jgi:L-serine dehydratase